jgi:hypothetical protein
MEETLVTFAKLRPAITPKLRSVLLDLVAGLAALADLADVSLWLSARSGKSISTNNKFLINNFF